ncbi:MAG: hypothetical protein ABJB49_08680, partial [Nitrospirota bacterium]
SLYVPGVNQEEFKDKNLDQYGVKVIPGTSDFFEIPEQKELQRIGGVYAEKYNQLLLTKIGNKSHQELLREHLEGK